LQRECSEAQACVYKIIDSDPTINDRTLIGWGGAERLKEKLQCDYKIAVSDDDIKEIKEGKNHKISAETSDKKQNL